MLFGDYENTLNLETQPMKIVKQIVGIKLPVKMALNYTAVKKKFSQFPRSEWEFFSRLKNPLI
jgi:hypothetical protein